MRRRNFAVLFLLFVIVATWFMGSQILDLLYFTFRSVVRMGAAYALSIVFSFTAGILIIHNRRAHEFLFPALDILQAIPILGFFPFALLFFVYTFPGGLLGEELSSVFLIFTAMTWAIAFAVIESAASLTNDMRDLAKVMNLKGAKYLTHLVLPLTFPSFVSGSITGWGGGWYFLVASEYLALGTDKIALPGLGAFIARSAFSYNLLYSFIGLAMLGFVVFGINLYVWQPLLRKARGFSSESQLERQESSPFIVELLERGYSKFCAWAEGRQGLSERLFASLSVTPDSSVKNEKGAETVSYALIGLVSAVFLFFLFFRLPSLLENLAIFSHALHSLIRLSVAFGIALVWTAAVAIFLARNRAAMRVLMPAFDLAQSIPAVSLFPIIVVLVVQTIGGRLGLEIASVLLVLTGMQWYLLFNLIRAVQGVPEDVMDLSRILRLENAERLRNVMIPAIMPAVFVGGLEAMGGGWNASIISEYIIGPDGSPMQMPGLGYLLSDFARLGNLDGIILAVAGITLIILLTNRLIWKPLIRGSDRYKF